MPRFIGWAFGSGDALRAPSAPLLCAATLVAAAPAAAQDSVRVLAGAVSAERGDARRPLPGATVHVTAVATRVSASATTDSAGRWRVELRGAPGDYLVVVTAAGWRTARTPVAVCAAQTTVDVTLEPAAAPPGVASLEAVRVRAPRPRPARLAVLAGAAGASAGDRTADGVAAALAPEQQGRLDAAAAWVPGAFRAAGGGVAVLGLGAEQSQTTLNGLQFPGLALPRELKATVRVATSPFDPAQGGFGGAQVAAVIPAGGEFVAGDGHLTLDAPPLQAVPVRALADGRVRRLQASAGRSGQRLGRPPALAARGERRVEEADATTAATTAATAGEPDEGAERPGGVLAYNVAAQLSAESQPAAGVVGADLGAFGALGVAPDTVRRLLGTLDALGLPRRALDVARRDRSVNASVGGRLDRVAPFPLAGAPGPAWWLAGVASVSESRQPAFGALALAPGGAVVRSGLATVQAERSVYVGPEQSVLNETLSAVSVSHTRAGPDAGAGGPTNVALPQGQVVLGAATDAGGLAAPATVGGFGGGTARTTTALWEVVNQTWLVLPGRTAHRFKLFAQSRLEHARERQTGAPGGVFTFASLADLAAGRAATFRRDLGATAGRSTQWNGALALTDEWSRGGALRVTGGVRLEANRFLGAPPADPRVAARFGVRPDRRPAALHASPRVGFTWLLGADADNLALGPLTALYSGPLGTAVAGSHMLRGGVGEFRATLPTGGPFAGVPTAVPREVACAGAATPVPDWRAYAADPARVPTACVGGAAMGSTWGLTDGGPVIGSLDPASAAGTAPVYAVATGFRNPRSWRATLGWTSRRVLGLTLDADALVSWNLDQPRVVDANLAPVQFRLAGEPLAGEGVEGGRGVRVPAAAIDPRTGVGPALGGRLDPAFGRVLVQTSDLRSVSRQLTVSATPRLDPERLLLRVTYGYLRVREQASGFGGTTADDPLRRAWQDAAFVPRHQWFAHAGRKVGGSYLTLAVQAAAGLRYTPLVAGDVNGDGLANDRAVLDPIVTDGRPGGRPSTDPVRAALDAELAALYAGADGRTRRCLDRLAAAGPVPNACAGPWTVTANARLDLRPIAGPFGRRAQLALAATNLLDGIDRIVHRGAPRGWGATAPPDPYLLQVRGFDAAAPGGPRFRYAVNPAFGRVRSLAWAPFRLTLDVQVSLAPSVAAQQVVRTLARDGRGVAPGRADVATLRARYAARVTDPYVAVLAAADSLGLDAAQRARLAEGQARFQAEAAARVTALADYLGALPARYDGRAAVDTVTRAERALSQAEAAGRRLIRDVLTPAQLRRLPPYVVFYLTADR